jgi:phosphohistidine phosphatase SixA
MRALVFAVMLMALPVAASAQNDPTPSAAIPEIKIEGGRLGKAYRPLIEDLRRGGYTILFRHERTSVIGDWDFLPFKPEECDRQRTLSEVGKASARTVGETMRALQIPVGKVATSTYCRAIEHGKLAFGGVHDKTPALIGPDGKGRTLNEVRRDVDTLIGHGPAGGNLILIGHHGTIDAYTTRMLDEGDSLIIKRDGAVTRIIAHMPAARWEEILRDMRRERFEP